MTYIIEFRNGSYFTSLEALNGGPVKQAKLFPSKAKAEACMVKEMWFLFMGGLVVKIPVA